MELYQQADPEAPAVLVSALSPALLRFFRSRRIIVHETAMDALPERPAECELDMRFRFLKHWWRAPPEAQREVITMLKVGGLSLEEVARATSSTAGAVKRKAQCGYDRLRKLLRSYAEAREVLNELSGH